MKTGAQTNLKAGFGTCLIYALFFSEGFSLFLYGLGSKKQLISTFQEEYLADYDHIVVNGFFPSLSLKNVSRCTLVMRDL